MAKFKLGNCWRWLLIPTILLLLFSVTGGVLIHQGKLSLPLNLRNTTPKDKYVAFLFEVYDTIKGNYWDKITDEQLTNIFVLGTEKIIGKPLAAAPKDKANLQKVIAATLNEMKDESKKKEFATQLADMVLANLPPFGRSRLYSRKEEISLKNTVENKNPSVDQYQVMGIEKDASTQEIQKNYQQKTQALKKEKTADAQQKLAQLNKAYQVLADQDARKTYDESGVEPTMEYKLLRPDIFYIHINKFSPTTIEELLRVSSRMDGKPESLNLLILDLKDNVGGAIDGLPYFLGPFIGNDQYAYQFYHQGNKEDFKTKIGWLPSLVRYKKVIVLINENTQSSAEVMAAVLKKYNVGVLVGTKTRGWGTVEKVFELKQQIDGGEKYSAFLVHSLTLREDGQPIEGKGVEPMVNTADPHWEKQLEAYFHYPSLAAAIREVTNQ
jgi:carboxyl-terminal processing protease